MKHTTTMFALLALGLVIGCGTNVTLEDVHDQDMGGDAQPDQDVVVEPDMAQKKTMSRLVPRQAS